MNTGVRFVLVLAIILFLTGIIFFGSTRMTPGSVACKWFGITLHFLSILVCEWTGVFAVVLMFRLTTYIPASKNSWKMIGRKFSCCFAVSLVLFVIIVTLDTTGTVHFNYQKHCWIGEFYLRLLLYFIPVLLVYVLSIVWLSLIISSIYEQRQVSKQLLSNSNQKNVSIHKIAIKLIFILGMCEIIGLVQIPKSELSENELIFNVSFRIIYVILRSFRGFLICAVYFANRKSLGKESEKSTPMTNLSK